MADSLNLTLLSEKLRENIADYSKIFQLKLSNGFGVKTDKLFTTFQIRDKVPLIREITDSIVQPGRKGTTNFTENAVSLKERWGQLRPFKVDLKLDEQTLYAWSKTYMANRRPTDPTDIYSFPAMDWYMGAINRRIGKDIHGAIYKGVYNSSGTSNVDITDGIELHLLQGYATSGDGAVGDIPADNQVTAASTINQSNILAQINAVAMRVIEVIDEPYDEPATLVLDPILFAHMINALDATLSNGSQVVVRDGSTYRLALLPNTTVEMRSWLKATSKILWTVNGNLAYLGPETSADVPSIDIEKSDRAIKIFIDGEIGLNYCDGRYIVMNSK